MIVIGMYRCRTTKPVSSSAVIKRDLFPMLLLNNKKIISVSECVREKVYGTLKKYCGLRNKRKMCTLVGNRITASHYTERTNIKWNWRDAEGRKVDSQRSYAPLRNNDTLIHPNKLTLRNVYTSRIQYDYNFSIVVFYN